MRHCCMTLRYFRNNLGNNKKVKRLCLQGLTMYLYWETFRISFTIFSSISLKTSYHCIYLFQNIFINELEEGDRSKAMNRLRVPPLTEREVGYFSVSQTISWTRNISFCFICYISLGICFLLVLRLWDQREIYCTQAQNTIYLTFRDGPDI